MFQIKNYSSIALSMVNHLKATQSRVKDFRIGAAGRTLIDGPAIEIDELYQQMFNGLMESIPVALYKTFRFDALQPAAAYTILTFSVSVAPSVNPIIIPLGTIAKVPGGSVDYATELQVSIAVSTTSITVRAVANVSGSVGNTAANTITAIEPVISGVSVNNANDVVSGRDLETEEERAERFQDFIAALSRGPAESIEYGAKTATVIVDGLVTEYVASAIVTEPYINDPEALPGYIECYIFNGVYSATADMVDETQKVIDGYYDTDGNRVRGWKAAGIICQVFAVTMVPIDIDATITAVDGYLLSDLIDQVDTVLRDYIFTLKVGATGVVSEIVERAMGVAGVYDFQVVNPTENVTVQPAQKLYVNALTLS